MDELQRHRLTFKVIRPVAWVIMKVLFNYEYDDLSKIEGPYLLLVNHNLELDRLRWAWQREISFILWPVSILRERVWGRSF